MKTSRDEPLARFTTMRVGGPADLFASVHNLHELRAIVRFARARAIPLTILGRGSDVVIADAGIRGLVVQNRAEGSRIDGERYIAESGVPMAARRDRDPEGRPDRSRVRAGRPGLGRRRGLGERRCPRQRRRGGPRVGRRPPRRRHRGPPDRGRAGAALPRQPFEAPPGRGRPRRDVPAGSSRARDDRRPSRRDPPLASRAPAARDPVGRLHLPQPARRLGRPADRRPGLEGPNRRRRDRLREARELHRQRPEGHRRRRPRPGRRGRCRRRGGESGVRLEPEVVFLGDWPPPEADR